MPLRIVFHNPSQGPYTTGSLVQGHLELDIKRAAQQDELKQINLYFSCRSKIRITRVTGAGNNRRTHYYNCKSVLFSRSYVLENSTFEIAGSRRGEDGGVLHFPFEFMVPAYAEGVSPEKMQLHSADALPPSGTWPGTAAYFDHEPMSQPLPDSLPNFHLIGMISRISLDGSVTYKVRAEVPNLGAGWKSLWIGKLDEDVFLPVRNLHHRREIVEQIQWHSQSFREEVRTLRLLPTHADGNLSFRERTRSIFKKSALPSLGLEMTFSAPQTLFLDGPEQDPLPFFLSASRTTSGAGDSLSPTTVSLDDKNSVSESGEAYDIPTPKVYLNRLAVTLMSHSQIRTNPSTRRYMDPGEAEGFAEYEIFEYKYQKEEGSKIELPLSSCSNTTPAYPPEKVGLHSPTVTQTLTGSSSATSGTGQQWSAGESLGVNHAMLQALGAGVVPDFATPNLARTYLLQWEVRVEVCGEEVKWDSRKGEGGLWVRLQRKGGGSGGGDDDDAENMPLPVYQGQDQGQGMGDSGQQLPTPQYDSTGQEPPNAYAGNREAGGLVPGMQALNVSAGASGEQLPSYPGTGPSRA